jgi:hypothetical protein
MAYRSNIAWLHGVPGEGAAKSVRNLCREDALPYDSVLGVMTVAEELRAIGFGKARREPACWRAVRLGPAVPAGNADQTGPEPACSPALLRWRALLARSPRPSPYRIERAED